MMNCRYLTVGGSVFFEPAVTKELCVLMVLDSTFAHDPGCPDFFHGVFPVPPCKFRIRCDRFLQNRFQISNYPTFIFVCNKAIVE